MGATQTNPVIRLDRTKSYSTVHGERTPQDPHYKVHFMQGDLPFDASGILVPDDGKSEPFNGLIEGQSVTYHPLYNKHRRELVERKIARLMKGAELKVEEIETQVESPDGGNDDVNLESWLRGEAQYEPFRIFAACKQRFHRSHTTLRSAVEDLVLDEKIVGEPEVAPYLMRMLDKPGSR